MARTVPSRPMSCRAVTVSGLPPLLPSVTVVGGEVVPTTTLPKSKLPGVAVSMPGGAMVLVNTVVIVRGTLDGGDPQVAWALGAFGGGSMLVALLLPKLLDHVPDRGVMLRVGRDSCKKQPFHA